MSNNTPSFLSTTYHHAATMKTLLPTSSVAYKLRTASNGKLQIVCLALFGLLVYVVLFQQGCHPALVKDLGTCDFQAPAHIETATQAAPLPISKPEVLAPAISTPKTQAKIGWVTMLWGNQAEGSSMSRAVKSQERYASQHSYPFFLLQQNLYNYIWSKPAMLLSVILNERLKPDSEQLKWIVWTDADSIVMNPQIRIEDILPPSHLGLDGNVHLITTSDIFGLNAGAMIYKVSEYSIDLLARSIAYPGLHPDIHLNAAEQSALERIILESPQEVQKKVVRMPQRYFNGYRPGMLEGQVTKLGNLMMHFPGGNKEYMAKYLDTIEGDNSPWSIPYEETEYPVAIEQFWREIRQRKDSGKPLYTPLIRT